MYLTPPKALIILAYGAFLGYEIRKHDIDKKVGAIFGHAYDEMTRRTASVMLDEAEKRANALPVKAGNASKT